MDRLPLPYDDNNAYAIAVVTSRTFQLHVVVHVRDEYEIEA